MTNRDCIIELLNEGFADGGATYEAMVYENIACPYLTGDKKHKCRGVANITRVMCYECKEEWLNDEVGEC